MLWSNFILGLNFISLCFKLIIINYHTPKQREIKFKPRIKIHHALHDLGMNDLWHIYGSKNIYHCSVVQKREVNLMMVARKYLPNNGNTADYFTKGSQPTSFAYTSEKVLNEVFADTEWDFNSDSGENEDLSYVEETDNENQQKNLKLMNSWLKMTIKKTHYYGRGRGTTCVQGRGRGHNIRQWTERF